MLKQFLYSILIFLAFNFAYKGIRYMMYDKVEGKVIRHESVTLEYSYKPRYSKKPRTGYKNLEAPVVECIINNEQISFPVADLEIIELLDNGDTVTVLFDQKLQEYKVGTFFNFWLTIYDLGIGIFVGIVGPVFYEICKALKKWLKTLD